MSNQCGDCRFWQELGDNEDGECRIRAPLIYVVDKTLAEDACWPLTLPWHWCGEFSPRLLDNPPEATNGD